MGRKLMCSFKWSVKLHYNLEERHSPVAGVGYIMIASHQTRHIKNKHLQVALVNHRQRSVIYPPTKNTCCLLVSCWVSAMALPNFSVWKQEKLKMLPLIIIMFEMAVAQTNTTTATTNPSEGHFSFSIFHLC